MENKKNKPEKIRYYSITYNKERKESLGPPPPPDFEKLGFGDEAIKSALHNPLPMRKLKPKKKSEFSDEGEYAKMTTPFWVEIIKHKATWVIFLKKDKLRIWLFLNSNKYVARLVWGQEIFMLELEEEIPKEQYELFNYPEYATRFSPEMNSSEWRKNSPSRRGLPDRFKCVIALCIKHKIPTRYASCVLWIGTRTLIYFARKMGLTFDFAGKFYHIRHSFEQSKKAQ